MMTDCYAIPKLTGQHIGIGEGQFAKCVFLTQAQHLLSLGNEVIIKTVIYGVRHVEGNETDTVVFYL